MACWICTFGSAYSSTLELNSAIRYFHALTNGLAMSSFRLRVVLSARSGLRACRYCQLIGSAGVTTPLQENPPRAGADGLGDRHRHDLRNDDLGADVDVGRADGRCVGGNTLQLAHRLAGVGQY